MPTDGPPLPLNASEQRAPRSSRPRKSRRGRKAVTQSGVDSLRGGKPLADLTRLVRRRARCDTPQPTAEGSRRVSPGESLRRSRDLRLCSRLPDQFSLPGSATVRRRPGSGGRWPHRRAMAMCVLSSSRMGPPRRTAGASNSPRGRSAIAGVGDRIEHHHVGSLRLRARLRKSSVARGAVSTRSGYTPVLSCKTCTLIG